MKVSVEISPGELLDKLSILKIKLERMTDTEKLTNVEYEYQILRQKFLRILQEELPDSFSEEPDRLDKLLTELQEINGTLWDVEDKLRFMESKKEWNDEFVQLARSVYYYNDQRSKIKRTINEYFNSELIEEKSYVKY